MNLLRPLTGLLLLTTFMAGATTLRLPPIHPQEAVEKCLSGWVIVQFTIDKVGLVKDALVVESSHPTVFHEVSLQAVNAWKFEPKLRNGLPVEVKKQSQKLVFALDKESYVHCKDK